MPLAIMVHGGAGQISEAARPAHRQGIAQAREAGRQALLAGASAVEAVVAAIVELENLPAFNAGYGSVLNSAGYVELDAGLMDGATLDIGSVAAVRDIRNPITLCQGLLPRPQIFFAKDDASRLADELGIVRVEPAALITPARLKLWRRGQRPGGLDMGLPADTVGAVALDARGGLASGTSTGGLDGKPVGRIGDAPLPGGGFYADAAWGACSTTGWGESLARILAARRAVEGLERGLTPEQAARGAIDLLAQRIAGGAGGLILLDRHGRIGAAFNTSAMTYAWWSEAEGEDLSA